MFKEGEIIKIFVTNKGNHIVFRTPKEEDLEEMLAFVNELIREQVYIAVGADGKELTIEEEKEHLDKVLKGLKDETQLNILGFAGGRQIASCSLIMGEKRKEHVGILGISILKDFRNEGVGSELLSIIIQKSKEMGLKILELKVYGPNAHAIHLYEKMGFKEIGRAEGMIKYKDGFLDEVWMARKI